MISVRGNSMLVIYLHCICKTFFVRIVYFYLCILCIPTFSFAQEKITTEGIPGDVNSKFQDVRPIISDNGKSLYINRRFHPENIKGDKDFQDVWLSRFDPRGIWAKPVNLGEPYNDKKANDLVRINANEDSLIFVNTEYKGVDTELALFLKNNKKAIEMKIDGFYNKSPYIDFDYNFKEKVIIMAVERKDTEGDQDLYYSLYQPNANSYSTPMNMGKAINSEKADFAPFLTIDGNTLFFASYGFSGQGAADLYMSHRIDNSWENWTEPENLGNIINSPFEETFVSISPDFKYLYYDSYPPGSVNRDVWRATLSDEIKNKIIAARENRKSSVSGVTAETKVAQPLQEPIIAEINETATVTKKLQYIDSINTNEELAIQKETEEEVPETKSVAQKPNAVSLNIEMQTMVAEQPDQPEHQGFFAKIGEKLGFGGVNDIDTIQYLDAGGKGIKIKNNIYFKFNSEKIQFKNRTLLQLIVKELNDKPQSKLLVEGHTDGIGGEDMNIDLSCRRAKNIKQELVSMGVNALRIEISCEGKERPIASNDDEVEGRELNRRVEFYLF